MSTVARGASRPHPTGGGRGCGRVAEAVGLLAARCRRYEGDAFCHIPDEGAIELDALAASDGRDERWNRAGRPTTYLASDPGVALAEYARHHPPDERGSVGRRVLRLRVRIDGILDLRDPSLLEELGVDGIHAFLDRDVARSVAEALRDADACRGILVPSMAFLDDPARHNLVLFADAIPGGLRAALVEHEEMGRLTITR